MLEPSFSQQVFMAIYSQLLSLQIYTLFQGTQQWKKPPGFSRPCDCKDHITVFTSQIGDLVVAVLAKSTESLF